MAILIEKLDEELYLDLLSSDGDKWTQRNERCLTIGSYNWEWIRKIRVIEGIQ